MEKGEWYRKEGFNDREWLPTGWVINARTILVSIDMNIFDLIVALIPYESAKAVCGMVVMLHVGLATVDRIRRTYGSRITGPVTVAVTVGWLCDRIRNTDYA